MLTITIKGQPFTISEPYAAGYVLVREEGQALNLLRAENIRNNLAPMVERELAKLLPGEALSPAARAELQQRVTQYDRGYKFQPRHRPRQSQLQAEITAVARERVEAELPDCEPEDRERRAMLLAGDADVQIEAARRIAERQRVADGGIEDL